MVGIIIKCEKASFGMLFCMGNNEKYSKYCIF